MSREWPEVLDPTADSRLPSAVQAICLRASLTTPYRTGSANLVNRRADPSRRHHLMSSDLAAFNQSLLRLREQLQFTRYCRSSALVARTRSSVCASYGSRATPQLPSVDAIGHRAVGTDAWLACATCRCGWTSIRRCRSQRIVRKLRRRCRNISWSSCAARPAPARRRSCRRCASKRGRGTHGLIGHTQPRRIAARAIANRLASELAYQRRRRRRLSGALQRSHRAGLPRQADDRWHPAAGTRKRSRLLRRYDTLIIDEAHERSLNIDFLLGVLQAHLLPQRPELRVIITSATIDPQRFADFFGGAPVIEVSGRGYPVEVRYRPLAREGGRRRRTR